MIQAWAVEYQDEAGTRYVWGRVFPSRRQARALKQMLEAMGFRSIAIKPRMVATLDERVRAMVRRERRKKQRARAGRAARQLA